MSQTASVPYSLGQEELGVYKRLRSTWRTDAERYARERLGMKPTWQQRKIFEAITPEGAKVSVRSGHGIGKSGATAGSVLWFLETRDFPKIPCTAPTSHQLRDVLWAEISKWIRSSDRLSRSLGVHPALWLSSMFRVTNDRIYDPSAKGEWFATARTSSKDNPDALQGFHASDVEVSEDGMSVVHHDGAGQILFIVDEAAGVCDSVFEVAEGALSSPGSRLLMLANPTRTTGYFADSHRSRRGEFTALHFRSSDSPLVATDYRAKLVKKWGEDSNVVRVRADGEFPKQDDDVLIALEWCEAAIEREPYSEQGVARRLGIDVARFGNDRTVYVVREGRNVIHVEIHAKEDTMRTAGRAVEIRKRFGCAATYPDVIGVGAGVCDRLRELGEPVIEVNVSQAAPTRKRYQAAREPYKFELGRPAVVGQDAQGKTLRDYLWIEGAAWLQGDHPSFAGVDRDVAEDMAGELSSVKYGLDSSGRIVVESKESMKDRLGFSPDIADALLCTFHPGTAGPRYAVAGTREF